MRTTMPGLTVADHEFTVPLDHADPGGRTIKVFAREIRDPGVPGDLPWALYPEGGPGGDAELAAYLRHFRADAIVADCEHIRKALGVEKWETWGQSYGGFIRHLRGDPRLQAGEESDLCGAGHGQAIRRQANRRIEQTCEP